MPACGLTGVREDLQLNSQRRVVVVDGLPETAAVLQAVLEPRGIAVSRCRRNRLADQQSAAAPPELLVVHDSDETEPAETESADWPSVPRVVIGRIDSNTSCESLLESPFLYGDLLRAIDRVLDSSVDTVRRAA